MKGRVIMPKLRRVEIEEFMDEHKELMYDSEEPQMTGHMLEGDMITIIGKLDKHIKDTSEELRTGTFWTYTADKKVLVLLTSGDIYYGNRYDIVRQ